MSLSPNVLEELVAHIADEVAARLLGEADRQAPAAEAEPWRLVDIEVVAARLGRSTRTIHSFVKERGLPVIRLDGGALAFDLDDVRAWARARRVPAEEPDPLAERWQPRGEAALGEGSGVRRRTGKQKAQANGGGS